MKWIGESISSGGWVGMASSHVNTIDGTTLDRQPGAAI